MSGEDCQYGFRHSSDVSTQWLPGSVRQLPEHQWWSVGDIAQHPPGSAGEQHGPQRGTMLDLRLRSPVHTTQRWFLCCYTEIKQISWWVLSQDKCCFVPVLLLLLTHISKIRLISFSFYFIWNKTETGFVCITSQIQADGSVADEVQLDPECPPLFFCVCVQAAFILQNLLVMPMPANAEEAKDSHWQVSSFVSQLKCVLRPWTNLSPTLSVSPCCKPHLTSPSLPPSSPPAPS